MKHLRSTGSTSRSKTEYKKVDLNRYKTGIRQIKDRHKKDIRQI